MGETPEECLAREVQEETGWPVQVGELLDSWIHHITQVKRHVFIVTYGCHVSLDAQVMVSSEHKEAGLLNGIEVLGLPMQEEYKRSVQSWFAQTRLQSRGIPPLPEGWQVQNDNEVPELCTRHSFIRLQVRLVAIIRRGDRRLGQRLSLTLNDLISCER